MRGGGKKNQEQSMVQDLSLPICPIYTHLLHIHYTYYLPPIFFHKLLHILNYISSSKSSCFMSLTFFILITTLIIILSISILKKCNCFILYATHLISEVEVHYNVVNVYPYYHGWTGLHISSNSRLYKYA